MDWIGLAGLVGAIGTIILGIAQIVGKRKEKELEFELKQREIENERRFDKIEKEDKQKHDKEKAVLSEVYARLYGYMWKLLLSTDADRVFIIQPHPLTDKQFISVSLEITHPDRDVVAHKQNFQKKRMSEWAGLVSKLSTDDWMIYRNVKDIKDVKIFSEAHRRGVKTLIFRKLIDEQGYWEGTLCVEYTHSQPESLDQIKGRMCEKANLIADILPEYKPVN